MPGYSGDHALSLPRLPSASHGHLLSGGRKGWTPPWKTVLLLSKITPVMPRYWSSLSFLVHQAIHLPPRLTLGSELFSLQALLCQMNATAPETSTLAFCNSDVPSAVLSIWHVLSHFCLQRAAPFSDEQTVAYKVQSPVPDHT